MIFALYMVILLYGQMVATNVASEKSSRAMELLVTSAKPTSMMFGKVLASCIAGFTQLVLVFGTAILLYNVNKEALSNPLIASLFNIPVGLFVYLILFFVLGFLIYAFMFGAIGSTASKLEDINTSVMPITFLFIIAFMVVVFSMTSGEMENVAMTVCSYIPFTSPMAMFTRIAMGTVAWYEILISVVILIGSVFGVGVISARIYRVGVLLCVNPVLDDARGFAVGGCGNDVSCRNGHNVGLLTGADHQQGLVRGAVVFLIIEGHVMTQFVSGIGFADFINFTCDVDFVLL
jgi:ABC-2 type transport system permease protein